MSKQKSQQQVIEHTETALKRLETLLSKLATSDETDEISKADKLSYWIEAWCGYLDREDNFKPDKLKRYRRGEIIKANLGFNIGSEEGGLHYAVVIEDNNLHDSTIRIVPLTSVKPSTDIANLKRGNVYLGNELFTSLSAKISGKTKSAKAMLVSIGNNGNPDKDILKLKKELQLLKRMQEEIGKMKIGSIALVSQITTISKMRIYDPKSGCDVLSNVKLSNEKLDMIDREIIKLYTKKVDKNIKND